jgi:hypothetical protein
LTCAASSPNFPALTTENFLVLEKTDIIGHNQKQNHIFPTENEDAGFPITVGKDLKTGNNHDPPEANCGPGGIKGPGEGVKVPSNLLHAT